MRIFNYDIVFQEVPDEMSLCITVCGCPLKCDGCHSPHTWGNSGQPFSIDDFKALLNKYKDYISNVVFMGGEWEQDTLITMLQISKAENLKTCLYTGLDDIDESIKKELTYLKTGRFIKELGGLNSKNTNQVFKNLVTDELLNYKFLK